MALWPLHSHNRALFNMAGSNLRHTHVWLAFARVVEHVFTAPALFMPVRDSWRQVKKRLSRAEGVCRRSRPIRQDHPAE